MICPHCGSTNFSRYRSPVVLENRTYRRHKCKDCKGHFLSLQQVPTRDQLEEALEIAQRNGSALTPSGSDSSSQGEAA